jgi:hypothetical protein
MKKLLLVALALPWICGCSQISTRTAPNTDLSQYQRIYVEHRLDDGHGMDQAIVRGLRHLGYDASFGPPTMMPHNTELVIRYTDEWNFDFATYPLSIDLQVYGAKLDKLLSMGHYYRPSIMGDSPSDLVDVVLRRLFKAKPPLPDLPPPSDTPDSNN